MARFILAPEHKKFFQLNGFISFETLIAVEEMKAIWKRIEKHRSDLPGLTQENLSAALPELLPMARKIGPIAAGLLDRKPIRLVYDCVVEQLEQTPAIEEREVGLLLSKTGAGFFFTQPSHLDTLKQECYLLLVFTANYSNNPILVK
ncbi:MAG: hypothetical protein S4CHLAM2_08450 [Chlamydiales bacterium]|nr:hypothetical protein [Chlamydiales bacterium]